MTDVLIEHGSYIAIVVVLILTGAGFPVPEEVPVIAAGVLSSHGALNPVAAFAACLIGGIAGDVLTYWIGYHFGRGVLRGRRWFAHLVTPHREAQIEAMFARHGLKVFFFIRFISGLRASLYLTSGILRVPFRRFLLVDLACGTVVISIVFGLSFWFGQTITAWLRNLEVVAAVGLLLVVGGLAFWLTRRRNLEQEAVLEAPAWLSDGELGPPLDASAAAEVPVVAADGCAEPTLPVGP